MSTATDAGRVVSSAARRFAARARSRRLRRWRPWLLLLAAAVFLATVSWVVLGSSLLAVRTVAVTGTVALTPEQVRAAADVPLGRPLARVDTTSVAERVGALPRIAAVEVVRRWPRTVEIVLEERTPMAQARVNAKLVVLDRDGVAFDAPPEPLPGLPLVVAGGADRDISLRAALKVLESLPAAIRPGVTEVTASTPEDVRIELTSGVRVVWGSAERSPRKALVLAALMAAPATGEASVYDVSAPDVPTTR